MKKQILSLMLSASILTVSPLFAMVDPNEPPHKTVIKKTASIDGDEEITDTRNLQKLPQHLILNTLKHLPINDILRVFQLSRTMLNICNQDAVWELLGKKHRATIGTIHLMHPTWSFKTSLSDWLYKRRYKHVPFIVTKMSF